MPGLAPAARLRSVGREADCKGSPGNRSQRRSRRAVADRAPRAECPTSGRHSESYWMSSAIPVACFVGGVGVATPAEHRPSARKMVERSDILFRESRKQGIPQSVAMWVDDAGMGRRKPTISCPQLVDLSTYPYE